MRWKQSIPSTKGFNVKSGIGQYAAADTDEAKTTSDTEQEEKQQLSYPPQLFLPVTPGALGSAAWSPSLVDLHTCSVESGLIPHEPAKRAHEST